MLNFVDQTVILTFLRVSNIIWKALASILKISKALSLLARLVQFAFEIAQSEVRMLLSAYAKCTLFDMSVRRPFFVPSLWIHIGKRLWAALSRL